MSFLPLILNIWIKSFNCFNYLQSGIDWIFHYSVKDNLKDFIAKSYDQQTTSIINLLIFNTKDAYSKQIYKLMANLSIVYLIVISGFHLSFINQIFNKTIKIKTLSFIISFSIILFYTYLLNFSISADRVLLSMLAGVIFKKCINTKYDKTCISGIISMIIFPQIATNIGFQLSYFCTFGVIFVNNLRIKSNILKLITINFVCIIISLPFVAQLNKQISIFSIINSFIFSYFILGIFLILFFSFWIKWIYPIQKYVCLTLCFVIDNFGIINSTIYLSSWPKYANVIYYWILLSLAIPINYKFRIRN